MKFRRSPQMKASLSLAGSLGIIGNMIIFLYGEDDFRAKQKLKELKDKFEREVDPSGSSFDWIEGEKATIKEINEKSASASLLSRKRMIVIENIFRTKTKDVLPEVVKYFKAKEKSGNDNIIIFVENFLKTKKKFTGTEIVKFDADDREKPLTKAEKELFDFLSKPFDKLPSSSLRTGRAGRNFTQEFKKFSNLELYDWIKKEASARGGIFTQKAVVVLSALTGGDLWQIDKEINKLINYKAGSNFALPIGKASLDKQEAVSIDENDVNELVKGVFEENIFALTDAIGARQKALALKLIEEEIRAGANPNYLLTMIIRQVKIILQVRAGLDVGDSPKKIASDLKLNSFVVSKAAGQARNFTIDGLKNILNGLIEIDYKTKTGQGDPLTLLNLLISKI